MEETPYMYARPGRDEPTAEEVIAANAELIGQAAEQAAAMKAAEETTE